MADTTFRVGHVVGLKPPAEPLEAAPRAAAADEVAVGLDSGDSVTARGPLARQWHPTLERLMSFGRRASFEIETSTGDAVALRVPLVTSVRAVKHVDDRSIVTLLRQPVGYELRPSDPRQRRVLDILEEARTHDRDVVVTVDRDRRTVLDAVALTAPSTPLALLSLPSAAQVLSSLEPVALANLLPIFEELDKRNCPHQTITPDDWCFPLRYHDRFCNTIASVVCHMLKARGIARAKLWLKGDMVLKTADHPDCSVQWDTHVAALVRLKTGPGGSELAVIDPNVSLDGPVLEEDWKAALTPPGTSQPVSIPSPPDVWWLESETNYLVEREDDVREDLDSMRTEYGARLAGPDGPPPYACSR